MVSFILFLRDAWTKMARDKWVRAAMTDDTVVVELLVGLKQSQAASASSSSSPSSKSILCSF
jgi:hypothetical protein